MGPGLAACAAIRGWVDWVKGNTILCTIIDAREESPVVAVTDHDGADVLTRAHILTRFETERCARVMHPEARTLRTVAHVLKREALAGLLGVTPSAVDLLEPSDRPRLLPPHNAIHVSLSHTVGAVAIAVARTPVGIDIETIGRSADVVALAQRYFGAGEADAVAADPSGYAFAWRWTAKEALKKAADIALFDALAQPMPADAGATFDAHGARVDVLRLAERFVCTVARMTRA